jgi:hypothetical protein
VVNYGYNHNLEGCKYKVEKIKQLEQRIVELETKNKLMLDAMVKLINLIDSEHKSFSFLSSTCGFR